MNEEFLLLFLSGLDIGFKIENYISNVEYSYVFFRI